MTSRAILAAIGSCVISSTMFLAPVGTAAGDELSLKEQLGKSIFFDQNLSINGNQACAACHGPEVGFTGPESGTNAGGAVYEGSIEGRFGNRKPPSAAYATLSPIFYLDKSGLFVGGNFWDGRATGEKLGNPAADQAQFPFVNPVEQALGSTADVVERVCTGDYGNLFKEVWGDALCVPANVGAAYDAIALSIAYYEDSPEVNAFSSKFDQAFGGKVKLTKQEQHGFALFRGKGKCARCHTANGKEALFTDFTYDNLGVPKNSENPFYDEDTVYLDDGSQINPLGADWVDHGLGGFLMGDGYAEEVYEEEWGKQKVPTLRNVGKGSCEAEPANPYCIVKAYGHNGYFKSLAAIVHFYNTRDVKPVCPGDYIEAEALAAHCWPEPEVSENVNTDELGDLGLTPDEEADIVAFLMTLSDGYIPQEQ